MGIRVHHNKTGMIAMFSILIVAAALAYALSGQIAISITMILCLFPVIMSAVHTRRR